jgi:hypothetical protein
MCEFPVCRVHIVFSKKKSTWRVYVEHYNADLNTTHGRDYVWWTACIYTKALDGNSYVPNLYRNDDGERRLDRNWFANEWNDRNRFLCVRNLISLHRSDHEVVAPMLSCIPLSQVVSLPDYASHPAFFRFRATSH